MHSVFVFLVSTIPRGLSVIVTVFDLFEMFFFIYAYDVNGALSLASPY